MSTAVYVERLRAAVAANKAALAERLAAHLQFIQTAHDDEDADLIRRAYFRAVRASDQAEADLYAASRAAEQAGVSRFDILDITNPA